MSRAANTEDLLREAAPQVLGAVVRWFGTVRAHLLEMAGDVDAALAEYEATPGRTTSVPEQNYLTTQAARLKEGRAGAAR